MPRFAPLVKQLQIPMTELLGELASTIFSDCPVTWKPK
ncbi:hypothetical protein C1O63_1507 [Dehalococcoides mccartyi]|nr:hypothetical protein C1O63_1507 [Dehalococcoides mccartyi]